MAVGMAAAIAPSVAPKTEFNLALEMAPEQSLELAPNFAPKFPPEFAPKFPPEFAPKFPRECRQGAPHIGRPRRLWPGPPSSRDVLITLGFRR